MSFDNCCKLLAEKYPERFASWLLGQPSQPVTVLKTELAIEPIRADSVIFLQAKDQILHVEFQVKLDSDPPLPLRFLDYWVRLYRLYRVPVTQVLVLLCPPAEGTQIESAFEVGNTRHEYTVLKLWTQEPELFLNDPILLPFAPLARGMTSEAMLAQVAERVATIELEAQRRETSAYTQLMAGLRFNKELIYRVFREGMMRESVIYQDILLEGERKGRQEGRQEGRQKGRQEGRQEGLMSLILRQLIHCFGSIPSEMEAQVRALSISQLEALGEAIFDFSTLSEVEDWLRSHQ